MTAALDFALIPPEVLEAIVEQVAAKLSLVPPAPDSAGLSTLRKSIDRRNCERRQADAVRGDRSGDGLSKIPTSVRRREWARRRAAAKKARIDRDRSLPLDLQPVNTERATAGGVLRTDRTPTGEHGATPPLRSGPLAGDVGSLVDRVSGYAESNPKRDRAWLYREAARIFREDLGLRLPETWSGAKDWGAAKALVRDYKREQLLEAIHATCASWRLSPTWSRPTLGLVLFQLRRDHPELAPAPTPAPPDPRRMTGAELEQLELRRARRASVPKTAPAPPAEKPTRREAAPTPAPTGLLQIAEPSPATSAEAQAVLELVNATAARCRTFRGRP